MRFARGRYTAPVAVQFGRSGRLQVESTTHTVRPEVAKLAKSFDGRVAVSLGDFRYTSLLPARRISNPGIA
jgi:hypothetical protein